MREPDLSQPRSGRDRGRPGARRSAVVDEFRDRLDVRYQAHRRAASGARAPATSRCADARGEWLNFLDDDDVLLRRPRRGAGRRGAARRTRRAPTRSRGRRNRVPAIRRARELRGSAARHAPPPAASTASRCGTTTTCRSRRCCSTAASTSATAASPRTWTSSRTGTSGRATRSSDDFVLVAKTTSKYRVPADARDAAGAPGSLLDRAYADARRAPATRCASRSRRARSRGWPKPTRSQAVMMVTRAATCRRFVGAQPRGCGWRAHRRGRGDAGAAGA